MNVHKRSVSEKSFQNCGGHNVNHMGETDCYRPMTRTFAANNLQKLAPHPVPDGARQQRPLARKR